MCHVLCAMCCVLHAMHCAACYVPCVMHRVPCAVCHVSCTVCHVPCATCCVPCATCCVPYAMYPMLCAACCVLHGMCSVLRHVPHALCCVSCAACHVLCAMCHVHCRVPCAARHVPCAAYHVPCSRPWAVCCMSCAMLCRVPCCAVCHVPHMMGAVPRCCHVQHTMPCATCCAESQVLFAVCVPTASCHALCDTAPCAVCHASFTLCHASFTLCRALCVAVPVPADAPGEVTSTGVGCHPRPPRGLRLGAGAAVTGQGPPKSLPRGCHQAGLRGRGCCRRPGCRHRGASLFPPGQPLARSLGWPRRTAMTLWRCPLLALPHAGRARCPHRPDQPAYL